MDPTAAAQPASALTHPAAAEVAQRELLFATEAMELDPKNYHAWAHRQYIVAGAQLWEQELAYAEGLLVQDVRNNSAWNQRAFILKVLCAARDCFCCV